LLDLDSANCLCQKEKKQNRGAACIFELRDETDEGELLVVWAGIWIQQPSPRQFAILYSLLNLNTCESHQNRLLQNGAETELECGFLKYTLRLAGVE
jgi:hypothetical protein